MLHLTEGEYPRQYSAADPKVILVKLQRLIIGGGALYREVQVKRRITVYRIVQHPDIRCNHGIHTQFGRLIDCILPSTPAIWLRIGIKREEHLDPTLASILNALRNLGGSKIQTGKMPGIGIITESEIDGIGAVIDCSLEGGRLPAGHTNSIVSVTQVL